jgi:hypothetical protein
MADLQHWDAWNVACNRRTDSNLARCYIEAIETLRRCARVLKDGSFGDAQAVYQDVSRIVSQSPPSYESDAATEPK